MEEEANRRGIRIPGLSTEPERIWKPLPGPQTLAYYSEADELFYGGQAGGGKSDLILGLALHEHHKSIIFRRLYSDLQELILRSQELIGDRGRFNGQKNLWRLAGERFLEFGAVQHEQDKQKFKGRPHDAKLFDELPDFSETQYRFLIAWNRTVLPNQRCRTVSTGNPPSTAEGEWVLRYWGPWLDRQHKNPAQPGELRWYAVVDGKDVEVEGPAPFEHKGETLFPKSRTFIPASVQDNPYLLASGYVTTLQNLPEPLRSQLLYGDFKAARDDDPWQVIPTRWVELAMERWENTHPPQVPLTKIGVDVARGGKDQTVLARRYGSWFASLEAHPGKDTPDGPSVAKLVMLALSPGADANIDVIGVGASAYDVCRMQDQPVIGVNFSEGSEATDRSGKLRMRNKRAEGFWGMREALDPVNGDGICLPPDPELKSDLCAPKWKITASGILIESKEDIKLRIGRSTDKGDAVVLALMGGAPAASSMSDLTDDYFNAERSVDPWAS